MIATRAPGTSIPGLKGALDDVPAGKPQTILVLGSDRRFVDIKQDNPARSDTMMLVRLDPSKEATAVMSLPRDLKVPIQVPGDGIDTTRSTPPTPTAARRWRSRPSATCCTSRSTTSST